MLSILAIFAGRAFSVFTIDDGNVRNVHMRSSLVHMNHSGNNVLLPADFGGYKFVRILEKLFCTLRSEPIKKFLVGRNYKFAHNRTLLFALQTQVAL